MASTLDVLAAISEGLDLLTDAERRRAAAFRRSTDRDDFVAAHLLGRLCASAALGTPMAAEVVQRCSRCGGEHGAPHVLSQPEAGISWSHAAGVVAAAAGSVPVGIDVEPLSHAAAAAEAQRHPGEAADALRLWVRREALVKVGRFDLDGALELALPDPGVLRPAGVNRTTFEAYTLLEARLPLPGHDVLVCAASPGPLELTPLSDLV